MVKAVVLIGVNRFESSLDPRLVAIQEAAAMRRIRRHPIIRGFSAKSIRRLKNPTRQGLADAIEHLFSDRRRDQLLMLVLSDAAIDAAIKHKIGRHPASTHETTDATGQKGDRAFGCSPAIAAGVVHELIDQCLAKQPDVSLDKHRSDAFGKELTTKEEGTVDVRAQLDGEGWTIITSSPPRDSQLPQNRNYPRAPDPVAPIWSRPAMMLGVSATVIVTLGLGSSYALLQTNENQQAKQSLAKAEAMQAKADYVRCISAASMIPQNASTYLAAQNILKTCEVGQAISQLIDQENYSGCIARAKSTPALQPLLHICRSEQEKQDRLDHDQQLWDTAQQLAVSHNFKEAVTLLAQISQPGAVDRDTQTLINQWSNQLLDQAANAYGEGRYDHAIALAQAIPASSLSYQQAQKTIDRWRQQWESNTRQLAAAQHALEAGIWHEAVSAAETIDSTSSYWRQQALSIIAQADGHLWEEARKEEARKEEAKKRCQQYQTDYQQGVVDVMAEVGPKGGAIREKCADLGIVIADAY